MVVLIAAFCAPTAMTGTLAVDVTSTAIAATTTTKTTTAKAKPSSPKPTTHAATAASSPAASAPPDAASTPAPADAVVNERADWSSTMNRLATLLADKDLPALQHMLNPSPVIRPFGSDALQTHERLLGTTTGSTVIGVHAYDKIPTTLASDLSNDFTAAGDVVPQSVREGMVPPDEAAAKRANETAADWLVQVLQPEKHEVMGVVILWPALRGHAIAGDPKRAIFVLVKGEKVDGIYALRQISFGDPLETPQ
jgi:hypothetical protein